MSRELAGTVAIVTGAATGTGKAIAFAFGAAGAPRPRQPPRHT
jgi:NAD(P)-dependent dehydrogenase (short-subunit alcohol dehydrogenase family)